MTIMIVYAVVTLLAIIAARECLRQHSVIRGYEAEVDELRAALDTDSIAIVDAAHEARYYKRQYERQLEVNAKLMERVKLHGN